MDDEVDPLTAEWVLRGVLGDPKEVAHRRYCSSWSARKSCRACDGQPNAKPEARSARLSPSQGYLSTGSACAVHRRFWRDLDGATLGFLVRCGSHMHADFECIERRFPGSAVVPQEIFAEAYMCPQLVGCPDSEPGAPCSQSQSDGWTVTAVAQPTWAASSANVRWCPSLAMAMVTHLVTRQVVAANEITSLEDRWCGIRATQPKRGAWLLPPD